LVLIISSLYWHCSTGQVLRRVMLPKAMLMRKKQSRRVTAFLKVLLGSTKQGVLFPDPAAGQGDKNLNPLAKEVLLSLAKPWESVSLSSVVVELVTACPDQLSALLGVLEDNWVPRDSPYWHMVVDLILTVVERQDTKTIVEGMKPEFSVGKVVENVIFPHKLVEKVISVGLDMDSEVSTKCMELLSVLVTNTSQFLSCLSSTRLTVAQAAVKSVVCIWPRWKSSLSDYDNLCSFSR
jgi:hypothetical protein